MRVDNLSELELPKDYRIGDAMGGGDCFFDAVAQGLSQIKPGMDFTAKSLRAVCKEMVYSYEETGDEEIKHQIIQDAKSPHDPGVTSVDFINDDMIWYVYKESIGFTSDEVERFRGEDRHLYETLSSLILGSTLEIPIWGRPDLEGRLICKKYGVSLHVVENHPHVGFLNQIVDQSGSKSVGEVDYDDKNVVHIINYNFSHFQPILKAFERRSIISVDNEADVGIQIENENSKNNPGVLEDCKIHNEIKINLRQKLKLPNNFDVGYADDDADCFFDAFSQVLSQIKPEVNFTVKSLRKVCREVAGKDKRIRSELRSGILKHAKYNSGDTSVFEVSDSMLWDTYLKRIEYTTSDVRSIKVEDPDLYASLTDPRYGPSLKAPVRGRPDIEGFLMCREFNVKLYILEEGDGERLTHTVVKPNSRGFLLADSTLDYPFVDYVNYNEGNAVYLYSSRSGHFRPIIVSQIAKREENKLLDYSVTESEINSKRVMSPSQNCAKLNFMDKSGEIHLSTVNDLNTLTVVSSEQRSIVCKMVNQPNYFCQPPPKCPLLGKEGSSGQQLPFITHARKSHREQKDEALFLQCLDAEEMDFFQPLDDETKMEEKLAKLNDEKLQKLYLNVRCKTYDGCLRLWFAIEVFAMKKDNSALCECIANQRRNPELWFRYALLCQDRGYSSLDSDVSALMDMIQNVLVANEKIKLESLYRHYEVYAQHRSFERKPIQDNLCFELLFFHFLSERIEHLKLDGISEPFEELHFIFIRLTYYIENFGFRIPHLGGTQMCGIFNYLNRTSLYRVFLYKQKVLLSQYLTGLGKNFRRIEDARIKKELLPKKSYRNSYKDYWFIRDIDSLNRIISYLELGKSVHFKTKRKAGKLIIQRVLQRVGEFFKIRYDSPYLSEETRQYLTDSGVPLDVFTKLRDHTSQSFTLSSRMGIESEENYIFVLIRDEFDKLKGVVAAVLQIVEAKQVKWQLEEALECTNEYADYSRNYARIYDAMEELDNFINNTTKALSSHDMFQAIKNFNNMLCDEKNQNVKISSVFIRRLMTLERFIERWRLKYAHLTPYSEQRDSLTLNFKKNKKLQAAVEFLLLDLMAVLKECELDLEGLVLEDESVFVEMWSNVSLRNYIGHGSTLLRTMLESQSENILNSALNFIIDKDKFIALVKLFEDSAATDILYDAIKCQNYAGVDYLNGWLNKTHEKGLQEKINEHRESILEMLKSDDYTTSVIDVMLKNNNLFTLVRKKSYQKMIERLSTDNGIDVNARDGNNKTIFYHVVNNVYEDAKIEEIKEDAEEVRTMTQLLGILFDKGYLMQDSDIKLLIDDERLFRNIMLVVIEKDAIANFVKMKENAKIEGDHFLCLAAKAGSYKIVSSLLKNDANPNVTNCHG